MNGPVSISAIKASHSAFSRDLNSAVDGVIRDAETIVYANVWQSPGFKPRTHALQEATQSKVIKTRAGKLLRFWNRKPYAAAMDRGAHPHFIFARKKKFLRFRGRNGQWVTKGGVKHPGNKPYRFLSGGMDKGFAAMGPMLEREMARAAKSFNGRRIGLQRF